MSREVYRFSDVRDDIFKSIFDKFTIVESEADLIFEKTFTDIFKVNEDCINFATEENIINNCATAKKQAWFYPRKFSLNQLLSLRCCQGYQ